MIQGFHDLIIAHAFSHIFLVEINHPVDGIQQILSAVVRRYLIQFQEPIPLVAGKISLLSIEGHIDIFRIEHIPIPANNWPLTPPICFGTPPPLPANRFRPPPRCWTPSPINFPPWSGFMPLWNRSTPPSKPTPPLLRKAQRPASSCTPSPPLWSSM